MKNAASVLDHLGSLLAANESLAAECERLRAWQREALTGLSEVAAALQDEPEFRALVPGGDATVAIVALVRRYRAALAAAQAARAPAAAPEPAATPAH